MSTYNNPELYSSTQNYGSDLNVCGDLENDLNKTGFGPVS